MWLLRMLMTGSSKNPSRSVAKKAYTLSPWPGKRLVALQKRSRWTDMEGARGGYPTALIRRNLYSQLSCSLARHLARALLDRQPEVECSRVL